MTNDALKNDKSIYFKTIHEENISFIVVNKGVLKFLRSKEIKEIQFLNTLSIILTFDRSKIDKSIDSNEIQLSNIEKIL